MALESIEGAGKYLDDLDSANPTSSDTRTEGDNHIRGIKNTLKLTFPNLNAAMTSTATELNYLNGSTPGTAVASKALVVDANKDITLGTGDITATNVTSTNVDGILGANTPADATALILKANTSLELATGATVTGILDEDSMATDSATQLATQQSIKAYVDSLVPGAIKTYREDTGQSFSGGNVNTFTHGLGALPDIVQVYIKCTSTDGSYETDDIVMLSDSDRNPIGSSYKGISVQATTTAVLVAFGDDTSASPLSLIDEDGVGTTALTAAKWEVYCNAIYFGSTVTQT